MRRFHSRKDSNSWPKIRTQIDCSGKDFTDPRGMAYFYALY